MLLMYFDPKIQTVDIFNRSLGAALLQEGKPIGFTSKSLMETQQQYANIEW